ncbi:MAG: high-affinity branched-chain amino acid ABC transporter permease LivM [Rhodospirillaceae bacterium]|nr:high-affinity branched-chain amino acid ABC transporter permease LivM [Rhodospirillaceae bacterium]
MTAVTASVPVARPSLAVPILKEVAGAALLTFALGVGLVGFQTYDAGGSLSVYMRFDAVAAAVVFVALGRLALSLIHYGRALAALLGALAVGALLALILVLGPSHDFSWRPFSDPVLNWLVVGLAGALAIRAAVKMRRAAAPAGARREQTMERVAAGFQQAARLVGPVLILFAAALPFLPIENSRKIVDIGTLILTYVMLGWGLNIVVGLAGLLDLGYVAFYAVGAYSYALLSTGVGLSFWLCLPIAGMLAASFGVLLGFPVLRLRGDYLAIVTLGFGEMVRVVLLNWWWFTGGPNGISDVPRPSFFGLPFARHAPQGHDTFASFFGIEYSPDHRIYFLYYLILVLALVTNFFTLRIRRLPLGRAWEALREDEIACRALGINPTNTKLTAFAVGAMFAGFAGCFFATRQGFVSPESFTFIESAVILAIVVLGGMGSQLGVVLATFVLIGLPEVFRELASYRMLAFGAGMVLIMIWRPRGLLAHREPTLLLNPRQAGRAPVPAST